MYTPLKPAADLDGLLWLLKEGEAKWRFVRRRKGILSITMIVTRQTTAARISTLLSLPSTTTTNHPGRRQVLREYT